MTKQIKLFATAFCFCMAAFTAKTTAQTIIDQGTTGNLTWVLTSDNVLTISGEGNMLDYVYPHAPWYDYRNSIVSVKIEDGVTSIGKWAFYECYELIDISIPNTIISIGSSAFTFCPLESIDIPSSVTNIEEDFTFCSALTSINVDSDNANYTSEAGVLFNKNKTTIIRYPVGKPEPIYAIPLGTINIIGSTFARCFSLTSVTIPSSITSMDGCIFGWIVGNPLTSITNLNPTPDLGGAILCEIDFPQQCTVTVPTSAVFDYQNAYGWKEFNIIGGGILVYPTVDNTEHGYVTGNDLYDNTGKATATVTAIAYSGYRFVNWTIDGSVVSTANPYSFNVTEDVELTAHFEEGEVGLAETTLQNGITVYPNPAAHTLTVQSEQWINNGTLTLFDMSGKAVLSQSINGTSAQVNMSSLSAGNYILRVVENGTASAGVQVMKN